MKTIVITLAMLASFGASAADTFSCASLARYAETSAKAHQSGVSLEKMLGVLAGTSVESDLKPVLLRAYSAPRYTTDEVKQREIARFRDAEHLRCLKG